ncbi:MAG: DsbA family protein, partial [Candidatus Methanomethylophilaceae archaeon]|nr:DsbA family protein [Candidatus Methanomethylophilaceae archaeon]
MIIKYWSDYACPFCYIAAARMKRAMKEMGIEDE